MKHYPPIRGTAPNATPRNFVVELSDFPELPAAACANFDPDWWFAATEAPKRSGRVGPDTAKALLICKECPERTPCLEYALTRDQIHGVWGGTTPLERYEMKRRSA